MLQPAHGIHSKQRGAIHPDFTGFSNSIHHDLALVRLAEPLPTGINYATFGLGLTFGDTLTLPGFGNYGYTTRASSRLNRRLAPTAPVRAERKHSRRAGRLSSFRTEPT